MIPATQTHTASRIRSGERSVLTLGSLYLLCERYKVKMIYFIFIKMYRNNKTLFCMHTKFIITKAFAKEIPR